MEDPWGSPWAATDDAAPPVIVPPAEVAHTESAGDVAPRAGLWEDDDTWGGWNDTAAAAANLGGRSPGWGRSPALTPVKSAWRDVSPGPWAGDRGVREGPPLEKAPVSEQDDTAADDGVAKDRAESPPLEEHSVGELDRASTDAGVVEDRAESPSVDLEPPGEALRVDIPATKVRQASKVQELVDMYDGISKEGASSPEIVSAGRSPVAEKMLGSGVLSSQDENDSRVPDDQVAEFHTTAADEEEGGLVDGSTSTPITKVQIDLGHLDVLFPSSPDISVTPEPIPDTIISDTFTSTSERRTWYRISRFGTMRKHNMGDDENYVRMDWRHSTVRNKTLRIVRRWMEEDSIAGRVTLGGSRGRGTVGAGMFNWNSSAPPVEIGELFAARKKMGHSRTASSVDKEQSPATATFGWSSPSTSPTSTSFPRGAGIRTKIETEGGSASRPQSLMGPSPLTPPSSMDLDGAKRRPFSIAISPAERPSIDQALAPSHTPPSQNLAKEGADEDEDDWGEMVSSPVDGGFANSVWETDATSVKDRAELKAAAPAPLPSPDEPEMATQIPEPEEISEPLPAPTDRIPTPKMADEIPQPRMPAGILPGTTDEPPTSKIPTPHRETISPTIPATTSANDEKIAAEILERLPDLSYMLR